MTRKRELADFSQLENKLGHHFHDQRLLKQALTHKSYGQPHNERLEFLGDGVLNAAMALMLHQEHPQATEGELSRLRAHVVNQASLVKVALKLDLGACLFLGDGELKSGGRSRESMLADAVEALFGAVLLDAGWNTAVNVVHDLLAEAASQLKSLNDLKDPKSRLQEWLQARKMALPVYRLEETHGDNHSQIFLVSCSVAGLNAPTRGQGASRRVAEQVAAELALHQLECKKSS